MPGPPRGRSVAWRVALAAVVVANTIVMWSDAVGSWWSEQTGADDGESILPGFVTDILSGRPDVGDADLHAIAWAVAGFVAVMASRRWSMVPWIVMAVWAWSVAVELLQPVVSDTRQFQWTDVLGNTLGVVLGAVLAMWWRGRRRRRRREDEGLWRDRGADVTIGPSPRSTRRT